MGRGGVEFASSNDAPQRVWTAFVYKWAPKSCFSAKSGFELWHHQILLSLILKHPITRKFLRRFHNRAQKGRHSSQSWDVSKTCVSIFVFYERILNNPRRIVTQNKLYIRGFHIEKVSESAPFNLGVSHSTRKESRRTFGQTHSWWWRIWSHILKWCVFAHFLGQGASLCRFSWVPEIRLYCFTHFKILNLLSAHCAALNLFDEK